MGAPLSATISESVSASSSLFSKGSSAKALRQERRGSAAGRLARARLCFFPVASAWNERQIPIGSIPFQSVHRLSRRVLPSAKQVKPLSILINEFHEINN